jgi:homocysteine S-methyltransferase
VKIPIVMGIWPLVSLRNAEFLKNEVPGVMVPDWVIAEMEKSADSKEDSLKRGIDIAATTLQKAQNLVAGFQVSAPFNNVATALKVIHAL